MDSRITNGCRCTGARGWSGTSRRGQSLDLGRLPRSWGSVTRTPIRSRAAIIACSAGIKITCVTPRRVAVLLTRRDADVGSV